MSFLYSQEADFWISYADYDSAQVFVTTDSNLYGFQFTLTLDEHLGSGFIEIANSELLQELGFTISISPTTGTIIAFSLLGGFIPPGEHHLFTFHWDLAEENGWIYFDGEQEYWLYVCDFLEFDVGDVNQDGLLDIIDIVLVINYILGHAEFSLEQLCSFDLNQDGLVIVLDILLAVSWILEE